MDILDAILAQSRNAARLLRGRGIVAVGVGYKITGGQVTGEPAVIVSVGSKLSPDDIPDGEMIPDHVHGVRTDVVQMGRLRALAKLPYDKWRPVRPGISIGHISGMPGTLGAIAYRGDQPFLLSNNHVLALSNRGLLGDPILQPTIADGGESSDVIAQLHDYVPLHIEVPLVGLSRWFYSMFRPSRNYVDSAIARPVPGIDVMDELLEIGIPAGIRGAMLGARVQKYGRTTGHSWGHIRQVNVTARVDYRSGTAVFVNQIITTPMTFDGDSGALVLDENGFAIAQVFAGSSYSTLMTPISAVLDSLNVSLFADSI